MNTRFFSDINYSAANEDGQTERLALGERLPGGQALCITGSGSRPLELLIAQPRRIVAIDFNASQNYLLELKLAAMRAFEYADYAAFLGLTPDDQRAAKYQHLRESLSGDCRAFWDGHTRRITTGVIYCGRWERYLHLMARAVHLAKGGTIRGIINSADINEQACRWKAATAGLGWRTMMQLLSMRLIWRYIAREPGIDLVPPHINIAGVIEERLAAAARQHLFRQCAFGGLLMTGRYFDGVFPCHLEARNYATIRAQLDKIQLVTGSLAEHLHNTQDRYDAFSASDFGSYAQPELYRDIWSGMLRSAAPGARVCERLFLVPREPEKIMGDRLRRESELEQTAAALDRSFIYHFVIGSFR